MLSEGRKTSTQKGSSKCFYFYFYFDQLCGHKEGREPTGAKFVDQKIFVARGPRLVAEVVKHHGIQANTAAVKLPQVEILLTSKNGAGFLQTYPTIAVTCRPFVTIPTSTYTTVFAQEMADQVHKDDEVSYVDFSLFSFSFRLLSLSVVLDAFD
jgi:hypothetical protein